MMTSSPSTSLTLLDRLRLPHQPDAWERFVKLYTPLLRDWARRQGFQEADAEDLTQEVLVKLTNELPHYNRKDGQTFRGWLFRVTANQCIDFRRRRATRKLPGADGLSGVGDDSPLSEFVEGDYRRALVHRGLEMIRSEFTDRTMSAFEQVMIQGRSVPEVAASLGLTENAVFLARHRVLTRLRQEIEGFLE
ncbi:MAG: sigma-70 family RNA polymerase sigma factor [Planctomycetia bacterium]|nr:sigma-70 family RNA polymerase sigma factor [Planctomycetia bacterium]